MFTTRNLFYLKISKDIVLPLYVYLDQQHVHWMSDYVLQRVLRDLKPLLGPKIALEGDEILHLGSKSSKATVEVVRGGMYKFNEPSTFILFFPDDYQFAFFFRKLEQHSVLIKSRNFRMVPRDNVPDSGEQTNSRPETLSTNKVSKAGRPGGKRGKKRARPLDSDEDITEDIQMLDNQPSGRSRVSRHKIRRVYNNENDGMGDSESGGSEPEEDATYVPDVRDGDGNDAGGPASSAVKTEEAEIQLPPPSAADTFPINVDEEDKPKMAMSLSYNGHYIQGRYLCVIVEPYPPLPSEQIPVAEPALPPEVRFRPPPAIPRLRDPSEIPSSSRAESVQLRSETPLFLRDDDNDSVRGSPPGIDRSRTLPPVPSFAGSQKGQLLRTGEENAGGLLAFSQALTNVRHEEKGDDSDEDYLRGDADEDQRILE